MSEFTKSGSKEMDARRALASEFYSIAFDEDEVPIYVSDEATLFDIFAGDEQELVARCASHYGLSLSEEHFGMPFWRLLDQLCAARDHR